MRAACWGPRLAPSPSPRWQETSCLSRDLQRPSGERRSRWQLARRRSASRRGRGRDSLRRVVGRLPGGHGERRRRLLHRPHGGHERAVQGVPHGLRPRWESRHARVRVECRAGQRQRPARTPAGLLPMASPRRRGAAPCARRHLVRRFHVLQVGWQAALRPWPAAAHCPRPPRTRTTASGVARAGSRGCRTSPTARRRSRARAMGTPAACRACTTSRSRTWGRRPDARGRHPGSSTWWATWRSGRTRARLVTLARGATCASSAVGPGATRIRSASAAEGRRPVAATGMPRSSASAAALTDSVRAAYRSGQPSSSSNGSSGHTSLSSGIVSPMSSSVCSSVAEGRTGSPTRSARAPPDGVLGGGRGARRERRGRDDRRGLEAHVPRRIPRVPHARPLRLAKERARLRLRSRREIVHVPAAHVAEARLLVAAHGVPARATRARDGEESKRHEGAYAGAERDLPVALTPRSGGARANARRAGARGPRGPCGSSARARRAGRRRRDRRGSSTRRRASRALRGSPRARRGAS